jgi:lipopolysaccharide/colanic/teichoic acid biosynthesis glycosyltransferase
MLYRRVGKLCLDLALTVPALILLTPLLACLAVLVRVNLGSPVLFTQDRPGLNARIFTIYKFRSMTDARDAQGHLLPEGQRITAFGRFLRFSSLDELPGLWNVVKGEMSLVGPRPLMREYLERYSPEQQHRHDVLPGITGWAQVNGRNALTWEQKFEHDLWYVAHQSLWLDVKILLRTIWKVLRCEGITQPGHATMEPFKGFQSEAVTPDPFEPHQEARRELSHPENYVKHPPLSVR